MKLDTLSKLTLISVFAMQNMIAASMAREDLDDKKLAPEKLAGVFGEAAAKDLEGFGQRNKLTWLLASLVRDSNNPQEVAKNLNKTAAHGVSLAGVDIRKTFDDFITDMIGAMKNPSPLKNAQTSDQFGISAAELATIRTALEGAGFCFNGNLIQSLPAAPAPSTRQQRTLTA